MVTKDVKADTVTAKRFQLVNDDGELRALMKTSGDNPIMEFMDHESRLRLNIQVTNDWPVINMMDERGAVKIELGSVNGNPALFFKDQEGNVRMGMSLSKSEGAPRLLFLDEKQQVRFGVVSDTEGTPRIIGTDQFGNKHKLMWFSEPAGPESKQE